MESSLVERVELQLGTALPNVLCDLRSKKREQQGYREH
jgi:hypothetical protein